VWTYLASALLTAVLQHRALYLRRWPHFHHNQSIGSGCQKQLPKWYGRPGNVSIKKFVVVMLAYDPATGHGRAWHDEELTDSYNAAFSDAPFATRLTLIHAAAGLVPWGFTHMSVGVVGCGVPRVRSL